MFWIEQLSHSCKYCICEQVWRSFKIINVRINSAYLEVYMTPEDGTRALILTLRNGEDCNSPNIDTTFSFQNWQHVKIEVIGGEVTLVGKVLPGFIRSKMTNKYPRGCPFGDIDEWIRERKYAISDFERKDEEEFKDIFRRNGSHHEYYRQEADISRNQRELDRLIRRKQNKKSLPSKIIAKEEERGRSKKTFRIRTGYLETFEEESPEGGLAKKDLQSEREEYRH